MHGCEKEREWGKLDEKVERFDKHIEESDKAGGYRDRVASAERNIQLVIWGSFLCAFVGSLIGQIVPLFGVAFKGFLKFIGFSF